MMTRMMKLLCLLLAVSSLSTEASYGARRQLRAPYVEDDGEGGAVDYGAAGNEEAVGLGPDLQRAARERRPARDRSEGTGVTTRTLSPASAPVGDREWVDCMKDCNDQGKSLGQCMGQCPTLMVAEAVGLGPDLERAARERRPARERSTGTGVTTRTLSPASAPGDREWVDCMKDCNEQGKPLGQCMDQCPTLMVE